MMKIFRSRKFMSAVLGALLVGLNDGLALGLKPDTLHWIAGILVAWILGESAVDAAHAWGGQAANGNGNGDGNGKPPGGSTGGPVAPAGN